MQIKLLDLRIINRESPNIVKNALIPCQLISSKNFHFILPDFYNKCPQVAFYIKNKNSLKVINYKPNYKNDDKKIIDIEQNINKENVNLKYYDFNMPKIPEKIHAIVEN